MKNWISKNYKLLIIGAFLVPIFTVALVSISHVTKWYGISNPISWAIYLSIGIEIAALSTLAAISADMGKKVYFPFGLVTLIQFIGNIYFAYSYIDINSQSFKDWVDLVSPMVEFMGVDNTDLVGHKRFLAFFAGGMLPIISLSFLHMLVKFTEEDRKKQLLPQPIVDVEKISREAAMIEVERERQEKYTPTEEELEKIEQILSKKYKNVDQNIVQDNQEFSNIESNNIYPDEKFSTNDTKNENIFQKEDESNQNVNEKTITQEEDKKINEEDEKKKLEAHEETNKLTNSFNEQITKSENIEDLPKESEKNEKVEEIVEKLIETTLQEDSIEEIKDEVTETPIKEIIIENPDDEDYQNTLTEETTEEFKEEKLEKSEIKFNNEGTHIPYYYTYGFNTDQKDINEDINRIKKLSRNVSNSQRRKFR